MTTTAGKTCSVSSYYLSVEEIARSYIGLPTNANTMKLYRNLGNGQFRDVTASAKLDKVYMPMGSNFGDVDNDGFLDIFFGTGSPSYAATVPACCCATRTGGRSSTSPFRRARAKCTKGMALRSPIWTTTAIRRSSSRSEEPRLATRTRFGCSRIQVNGNDWLGLNLVGVKTNRAAIGARITVTVESRDRGATHDSPDSEQRRLVRRVSVSSSISGSAKGPTR